MHLRNGSDQLLDAEGSEFEDLAALRGSVMANARGLMAGDVRDGLLDLRFRIDAEDESGEIVYSLPFAQAVNVVPEPS